MFIVKKQADNGKRLKGAKIKLTKTKNKSSLYIKN